MISRLFIIHPSEIVRKGLLAILRNYFSGEIIVLSESELPEFDAGKESGVILFCNRRCKEKLADQWHRLKTVVIEHEEVQESEVDFDFAISLNSSRVEIGSILTKLTKPKREAIENESDELTVREKEVLKLVGLGYSNKMIAERLFISIHTVISHRKNITEKIGIKSISGLTVYAILNKLIDATEINPEDLI